MENLQTAIHKFFYQTDQHSKKIDEIKKRAAVSCNSILNQSTLLRAVTPLDSLDGTPYTDFPGFRESLINSIIVSLDKELPLLKELRFEFLILQLLKGCLMLFRMNQKCFTSSKNCSGVFKQDQNSSNSG